MVEIVWLVKITESRRSADTQTPPYEQRWANDVSGSTVGVVSLSRNIRSYNTVANLTILQVSVSFDANIRNKYMQTLSLQLYIFISVQEKSGVWIGKI